MRDLLRKMQIMEQKMEKAEQQSEYWTDEKHFNIEKSSQYEAEADRIYKSLYQLHSKAADMIVSITSGKIDKRVAMEMIRSKRTEVERIFA